MKNILFVTVGLNGGGAERVMTLLANNFIEEGNKVSILMLINDTIEYNVHKNINIISTHDKKKDVFSKIKIIRKTIKDLQADTVISFFTYQNIYTIIASIGLKCKVIVSERNDPSKTVRHKFMHVIRNYVYRLADKIVFQTLDAMDYFPMAIRKKGVIIPNPIKANLPQRYEGERKKKFVAFSRLTEQKNITLMIDACENVFKKYNDYKLEIYGQGELENELKRYVESKELNNKIIFKGFCKDIHSKINDAKLFISTSDYEGISNSMLEAFSMGIPCICTDCPIGGARMVIENRVNGILIDVGDMNKLEKAIVEIINNEDLANKISINAYNSKDRFSEEKIILLWKKILQ